MKQTHWLRCTCVLVSVCVKCDNFQSKEKSLKQSRLHFKHPNRGRLPSFEIKNQQVLKQLFFSTSSTLDFTLMTLL